MAEIDQGIKYTIEADASKAEKTLQNVGQQAAQNGQQIEKAMAGASAVTSALNGDFVNATAALGRMTKSVSGLGKVIAGAMGWVAIIGAVVAVFKKWKDSIEESKEKLEQIRKVRFDEHLDAMKTAQEGFNAALEKSISDIDKQLEADTRSLDLIKEKTKAQIELNRQIALEGRSAEEKELINASANTQLAQVDRDYATSKIVAQIAAQGNRTQSLQALLKKFDEEHASRVESYQDPAKAAQAIKDKATEQAMWNWLGPVGPYEGVHSEEKIARAKQYVRNNPDKVMDAMTGEQKTEYERLVSEMKSIEKLLDTDYERREKIEEAISESEAKEKELAEQKKIDEIKEKAAIQAEKNLQEELGQIRLEEGIDQAREIAKAQREALKDAQDEYAGAQAESRSANERLAAAKQGVQQAWGWYRDKNSMKAQMEEEKANAEAEKQFQKDFEKLKFRRDWRTLKNLSVDEEATRRVALAREEEDKAQKYVEETADNTARAAEAVEAIREAIENGGGE